MGRHVRSFHVQRWLARDGVEHAWRILWHVLPAFVVRVPQARTRERPGGDLRGLQPVGISPGLLCEALERVDHSFSSFISPFSVIHR